MVRQGSIYGLSHSSKMNNLKYKVLITNCENGSTICKP